MRQYVGGPLNGESTSGRSIYRDATGKKLATATGDNALYRWRGLECGKGRGGPGRTKYEAGIYRVDSSSRNYVWKIWEPETESA